MTDAKEKPSATRAEYRSGSATRPPVVVDHDGRRVTLQELADTTGLKYACLWERHRKGLRGADLVAPGRPARNRRESPSSESAALAPQHDPSTTQDTPTMTKSNSLVDTLPRIIGERREAAERLNATMRASHPDLDALKRASTALVATLEKLGIKFEDDLPVRAREAAYRTLVEGRPSSIADDIERNLSMLLSMRGLRLPTAKKEG